MLDNLGVDDSDSPAISLVPPGVGWEEVQNHIRIGHDPLLVIAADSGRYQGAYWTGTKMVVTDDLGPDQEQAVGEFREILRERGEA
jgi:hypothetical protein